MPTDVIMPALGIAQEKGSLVSWLKKEGQSVTKGEPLMEVETDKATVEVEAPASGLLAHVTAAAGDEVPVGQRIAVILAPGESLPGESAKAAPPSAARAAPTVSPPEPPSVSRVHTAPVQGRIAASPAARRIAKERGVDLASLKGSGPRGEIVTQDVQRAKEMESGAPGGPPRVKETVPLSAMRRIVGERMSKSKQTAPHFYVSMEVDMSEVTRKRAAWKGEKEGPVPSINDFILWAAAQGLRDFPLLNAAFTDKGIQIFSDINIGIAVAVNEGLVVPVIRNADRLTLQELARQGQELAEKATRKKLFPLDYEG